MAGLHQTTKHNPSTSTTTSFPSGTASVVWSWRCPQRRKRSGSAGGSKSFRRRMCCTKELTVSGVESFPGELDTLRADNARLRRLLQLSEEQAHAAASDQATVRERRPHRWQWAPILLTRCGSSSSCSVVAPMFTRCARRNVEMAVRVGCRRSRAIGARVWTGPTHLTFLGF